MKGRLLACLLLIVPVPIPAADWQVDPDDALQRAAKATAKRFRNEQPELQRYFDEAWAYAIFPHITRGGFMFGGAWGRGIVVQGGRVVGHAVQWQLTIGAQLGAQRHAQIIFFRDEPAFTAFKSGRNEFIGQASIAGGWLGAGVAPGHEAAVAIFNRDRWGLMFEAVAGGVRYRFTPID